MDPWTGLRASLLIALSLAAGSGLVLEAGEVTIQGASSSGTYGTGFESDDRWFSMSYVTGKTLQFRAELSMIGARSESAVAYTALGPIPLGSRGRGGRGDRPETVVSGGTPSLSTEPSASVNEAESDWASGLGDLRLAVSRKIAGGGVSLYRIDASAEMKVPTADEEENLGTGEWDYRLALAGEYRFWSATGFIGLGWNRLGDPSWAEFNDVLDAFVGVDSDPVFRSQLVLTGWLEGTQEAVDSTGHRAALGVGVRTTGSARWSVLVRTGLTEASADLAVIAGLSFGVSAGGPGSRGYQW